MSRVCAYKGFEITNRSGFVTDKLTARNEDDEVHTRRYSNSSPALPNQERALELLKKDIDRYS